MQGDAGLLRKRLKDSDESLRRREVYLEWGITLHAIRPVHFHTEGTFTPQKTPSC